MKELEIVEVESKQIGESVQSIKILCQNDYEKATAMIKGVDGLISKVKETFDPIVQKAHAAWKESTAQRSKYLDPLEKIKEVLRIKRSAYLTEIENKRQAEEEKLRREAEEKAERERQALLNRAKKADANGNSTKAEALKEQADSVFAQTPIVAPKVEKVEGDSSRKYYYAEVIDFKALPDEYKLPNTSALNAIAKSTKGSIKIPGVSFKWKIL